MNRSFNSAESCHQELNLIHKILSIHLVQLELLEPLGQVFPLAGLDDGGGEEVGAGCLGHEHAGVGLGPHSNELVSLTVG